VDDSGVVLGRGAAGNISGMGKVLPHITDGLREFIERQHGFFVATAPLAGGHVSVSAKGMDSFLEAHQRENNVRSIDGLPTPVTGPTRT
jgi:hypothetical protein